MRSLVFCTTCKHAADHKTDADGRTGGERLIEHVRDVLMEKGGDHIQIAEQECLWSCKRHCNVWFRDTERFSYIAGDFEPTRAAAEAIVGWFELHGESELGTVPFRQWPDGMRGHFIARMPPEDG
ncbi:MAG: DUF1636 domain-containing protein [Rhizobiales bacterium]|nr:DUF1636 domain-containing protein [Hyphomicrobiales bacterium]